MVYEDVEKIYAGVAKKGRKLLTEAIETLVPSRQPELEWSASSYYGVNTLNAPRIECIEVTIPEECHDEVPAFWLGKASSDKFLVAFEDADGSGTMRPMDLVGVGRRVGWSFLVAQIQCNLLTMQTDLFSERDGTTTLDNGILSVVISGEGRITSIFDHLEECVSLRRAYDRQTDLIQSRGARH